MAEAAFVVRNRRFISPQRPSATGLGLEGGGARPTVFAVIPVFNRLKFTRECIKFLQQQTYQPLRIVVADGGSTDGTPETIAVEFPDVAVLTTDQELWWSGAMAMGIDYVLRESRNPQDFVLMMNNDTEVPADYVATLVQASQTYEAAVGALVVDSRDPARILDAGEYVDWSSYSFPVKNCIADDEVFCDKVDVLPGRGSLVPLRMIQVAGNVDCRLLPHYLADYEFFYRLKRHGCQLGVCYETQVHAHIEETGIVPGTGSDSFRAIWRELFSRRSMNNVIDHWRFVGRHAPDNFRAAIRRRLLARVLYVFMFRTPLRPLCLPALWVLGGVMGQVGSFSAFAGAIREKGRDVLCHPTSIPALIRLPLYFFASPGPFQQSDCARQGLEVEKLLEQGVIRPLGADGWYVLVTLDGSKCDQPVQFKRLFWSVWTPLRKVTNTWGWRRDLRQQGKA